MDRSSLALFKFSIDAFRSSLRAAISFGIFNPSNKGMSRLIPNVELAAFWSTITPDLDVERPNWKLCPRLPFRAGSQLYLLVCKSTFRLSCSCSFCFKSILCSMAYWMHSSRLHCFTAS